ncbi:hypothetical protein CR513_27200, partial [Mucuna pruriens]
MCFVGYSSTQKGYRCYHPPSKKFLVSRDITFHEDKAYFKQPYLQWGNYMKLNLKLLSFLAFTIHVPKSKQTSLPSHQLRMFLKLIKDLKNKNKNWCSKGHSWLDTSSRTQSNSFTSSHDKHREQTKPRRAHFIHQTLDLKGSDYI